jgi:hypothetical protein
VFNESVQLNIAAEHHVAINFLLGETPVFEIKTLPFPVPKGLASNTSCHGAIIALLGPVALDIGNKNGSGTALVIEYPEEKLFA